MRGQVPGGFCILNLLEGGNTVVVQVVQPLEIAAGFFKCELGLLQAGINFREVQGCQQLAFFVWRLLPSQYFTDDAGGLERQHHFVICGELPGDRNVFERIVLFHWKYFDRNGG